MRKGYIRGKTSMQGPCVDCGTMTSAVWPGVVGTNPLPPLACSQHFMLHLFDQGE